MSKTAAAVLVFVAFAAFSMPMSAQLLPNGNVYAGISYGQITNVVNQQSYRGWNGSAELFPLARFRHFSAVLDGSGFYRSGITAYNGFGGIRVSSNMGRWRPFAHGMYGIRHINSAGIINNPLGYDIGGGADYKLPFKNFSWRVQADYMHTHYLSATQADYRASTGIVWRF